MKRLASEPEPNAKDSIGGGGERVGFEVEDEAPARIFEGLKV